MDMGYSQFLSVSELIRFERGRIVSWSLLNERQWRRPKTNFLNHMVSEVYSLLNRAEYAAVFHFFVVPWYNFPKISLREPAEVRDKLGLSIQICLNV